MRTIRIVTSERDVNDLLEQLKKFAEENGFAIRVGHTTPDGKRVLVQMWREDIKIIAVNPFDTGAFRVSFYQTCACSQQMVPNSVGALFDKLKSAVSAIPGITVSDQE
jgi:hypothetical protein